MIDAKLATRFRSMDEAATPLNRMFASLTRAHMFFQGPVGLRTISVSDMTNGSIEATFHGVRIKFELVLVFGPDGAPRGRVICTQSHCTYGDQAPKLLGCFHFDQDGVTDLPRNLDCMGPRMDSDAPAIVLRFLDAAFTANSVI